MCSACGFPTTQGHWSEAGAGDAHQRTRARFIRVRKLDAILRAHGLTAHDDGLTPDMQIADRTGRVIMARDLREVWMAVEKLLGRPLDPLDPHVLSRPGQGPPGAR
ncbi:MAG: hypothetical protein AB7F09_13545 [Parvibaculaceae bacterium]